MLQLYLERFWFCFTSLATFICFIGRPWTAGLSNFVDSGMPFGQSLGRFPQPDRHRGRRRWRRRDRWRWPSRCPRSGLQLEGHRVRSQFFEGVCSVSFWAFQRIDSAVGSHRENGADDSWSAWPDCNTHVTRFLVVC